MSASELQHPQFYSQEDVQRILNLAIVRKTDTGELSREQLWEIAAELDIDSESLKAAELDWLNQKALDQKRLEFDRYQKINLKHKVVRYVIANSFLISLNLITAHNLTWAIWILLLWGTKLSLDTWNTFYTQGEAYEKAFQGWIIKNEMKQSIATLWDKFKRFWQS
jgi:hypothetical protein